MRYDANSGFGGQVTWRFAPTYLIAATGTKLKASAGTGFKAPTLSERFQDFPSSGFFGNPDLKPETSIGYDLGFEQSLLDSGRLQFGATWYHNAIRNLIDDNATFSSYTNVGRAHTQGVESFIALKPIDAVSLRVDLHLYGGGGRHPAADAAAPAARQVEFRRSLAGDAPTFAGREPAVGRLVDRRHRQFTVARLTAPGYTTVDLAAGYDLTPQVTIYGRITNLADERYENPVGFQHPGRGVFAGVKARF